jgi:hypothetical protein
MRLSVKYSIEVEPSAVEFILRLPKPIQLHIAQSLKRLENDPESEGKPTTGLYAAGYLLELEYALGDLDFYIDVLYRFDVLARTVNVFQVMCEYV